MRKILICLMLASLIFISGCHIANFPINNNDDNTTDIENNSTADSGNNSIVGSDDNGLTDTGSNNIDDSGNNSTNNVTDYGVVRTVINWRATEVSLPHYLSTEITKHCLITNDVISANVYLGHLMFRDSNLVPFSDFVLDMSALKDCSFSIAVNYNGENRETVVDSIDYVDNMYKVIIEDVYGENEDYKGSIVNYSKYHNINLNIASMIEVPYGYVNIEFQMQLPDGTEHVITSDTVYYSVTDAEIVFGLVSNPIAHEGDPGIITNGWIYKESN